MRKIRKSAKYIFPVLGLLLIIVPLCITGYYWFYKFAPLRRLEDNNWVDRHSAKACWEEEKKSIKRAGNLPDMVFRNDKIGFYGDKRLCIELIEKVNRKNMGLFCGCMRSSLALMTNHSFDSPEKWKQWLSKNSDKIQEEWIRDGFIKYGVHIKSNDKLTDEQAKQLLRLCVGGPGYIQYNACRWLRDSKYDTSKITLKSIKPEDEKLFKGLCQYMYFLGGYSDLGELQLDNSKDNYTGSESSWSSNITGYIPHWPYLLALFIAGVLFFIHGLLPGKKPNKNNL